MEILQVGTACPSVAAAAVVAAAVCGSGAESALVEEKRPLSLSL